jgi:hypothetical protein
MSWWIGAAFSCPAFQITYAKTGYQVSSGMDYAINYELRQLIARHERLFHRKAPADFKITYRIFLTRNEFEKYSAESNHSVGKSLLGYTKSTKSLRSKQGDPSEIVEVEAEIVSWNHEQPAVHLATLLHETTHAVTHAFLQHVPLWMNEGSADWFGRPAWANGKAQKSERARRWQTLKRMVDEGKLPPLRAYLETESYEDWDEMFNGNTGRGYLIGYSLFDFFMSHADAQAFLAGLLKAPEVELVGQSGMFFTAQLDKLWHGGLPGFERGWQNWIRRQAEAERLSATKGN